MMVLGPRLHTGGHTRADADVPIDHACCADSLCSISTGRQQREAQSGARHRVRYIVFHIERGDLLAILEHPHPERYGGQRIFVVRRDDYVYLVPFVEDEHTVFLKTIIPGRRATKRTWVRVRR